MLIPFFNRATNTGSFDILKGCKISSLIDALVVQIGGIELGYFSN